MPETDPTRRVLVTVTGRDAHGITAALTGVIDDNHAELLDVEQVVVQGQLTLCLLVEVGAASRGEPVIKDLLFTAHEKGLELEFEVLDAAAPLDPPGERYAVTLIGDALGAGGLHRVAAVLAAEEANIEQIRRLSAGGLTSAEILVALPEGQNASARLRAALVEAASGQGIDVAVQPETLTRRTKRLVVMDMDSTLIRIEVIDELARLAGVVDRVAAITARAMAGELDFEASLRERVALLEGLDFEKALALARRLPVTEGAREMLAVLRRLGLKTGVLSGGFTFAANELKHELGLDYVYANELEVRDGKLTGGLVGPIVGAGRKADLLETIAMREGIGLDQTIAIGDGANDLPMLGRAGLGIAFHAKPKVKESADTALSAGGLDRILYLLGLHERDVRALLEHERAAG